MIIAPGLLRAEEEEEAVEALCKEGVSLDTYIYTSMRCSVVSFFLSLSYLCVTSCVSVYIFASIQ